MRAVLLILLAPAGAAVHADEPAYGAELQGFACPYLLHHFLERTLRKDCMWPPRAGSMAGLC